MKFQFRNFIHPEKNKQEDSHMPEIGLKIDVTKSARRDVHLSYAYLDQNLLPPFITLVQAWSNRTLQLKSIFISKWPSPSKLILFGVETINLTTYSGLHNE